MNLTGLRLIMAATFSTSAFARTTVHDVDADFDLPFLGPGRQEKLDLYRPVPRDPGERFPGIVIIHGGGWSGGIKSARREINIGTNFARMGYVCISIDYVLATRDKASWPENIYDCKRAVQFLRVNAERWQLDTDHIGCIGGSAGGHLSAFLATAGPDAGLEPEEPYGGVSSRVQAAVDLYGIADLAQWRKTAPDGTPLDAFKHASSARMLGATCEEAPDLWQKASPYHQADAGDPPIFILHGKADTTVDYRQSIDFAERLDDLGVENELMLLEDIGHTFDLQRWGSRELDDAVRRRILSFFDRHLKRLDASAADARYERLLAWEAVHPEAASAGTWTLSGATVSGVDEDLLRMTVQRNGFPLDVRIIPASRFVLQSAGTVSDLKVDTHVVVSGSRMDADGFRVEELTTYAPDTDIRSVARADMARGRLGKDGGIWVVRARGNTIHLDIAEDTAIALRTESSVRQVAPGDQIVYARCRKIGAKIVGERIVFTHRNQGAGGINP